MAQPMPAFHLDPNRSLKEVTAYLHGEFDAETKAAFEGHLETCERCQRCIKIGRRLFPIVDAMLAEDPVPRRPEEYLRLWEEAKQRAAEKSREAARPRK